MIDERTPLVQSKSKSYYYPSVRRQSLIGKDTFKPRFPKQINAESRISKFCKWLTFTLTHKRLSKPSDMGEVERLLPMKKPEFTFSEKQISFTWLGHSTAIISIGNQANFLIDPVFSERCFAVQWIGPKRYRPPACQIRQLPPIHAVLVSHDHYDHLDRKALNDIQELFHPTFFVGLGSKDVFPEGCKLKQMDWTETQKVKVGSQSFQITFVPVCHWAKRGLFDGNTRLWGGFIIKTPKGHKIFYSGDTAYCQIFQELGAIFGPFDLSILPIGAYQPRHLLSQHHTNPEEAVLIHKQLKSKKSVGVHWGTFPLGFQHYYSPKISLQKYSSKHGLQQNEFVTLQHGESLVIPYK